MASEFDEITVYHHNYCKSYILELQQNQSHRKFAKLTVDLNIYLINNKTFTPYVLNLNKYNGIELPQKMRENNRKCMKQFGDCMKCVTMLYRLRFLTRPQLTPNQCSTDTSEKKFVSVRVSVQNRHRYL